MSKPSFYFYCYPWDLEDEGLEVSLGRLAGEIGVDGITVAATETDIRMIRGRPIGGRRTFICPAGAHFQPDPAIHRGNRIRPIPAAWMKSKNSLERIAKIAQREHLDVRARIVCCEGKGVAERYPHAVCINAFGDPIPGQLCPNHPDVREYVALVVNDLTKNYPISAIELAEFGFGSIERIEWYPHTFAPHTLRTQLCNWCFCPACRQRTADANFDSEAVRSSILQCWNDFVNMKQSSDAPLVDPLADSSVSSAFESMRTESVTQLVRGARAKSDKPIQLSTSVMPKIEGVDLKSLRSVCEGIAIRAGYFEEECIAQEEIDAFGGTSRCAMLMECIPPTTPDGASLVAAVHRTSQMGFAAVGFENYGLAPNHCLDWVRQAIRYAKRESGI
jgi:Zn-finger protein